MWWSSSSRVDCFYCNSTLSLIPPAPSTSISKGKQRAVDGPVAVGQRQSFWCGVCGIVNRRDQNGEIVSDEAAFFDSSLNDHSFARRGTPSRQHLPSPFPSASTTPFCRQCLSNQALQIHLLSSYPSSSSSEDEDDSFPPLEAYRASLDARYPLVCPACAPQIEGTIRERDYRVKTQALGWRLRETQRAKEREERLSEQARKTAGKRWFWEGVAWKARGVAWAATNGLAVLFCCGALVEPAFFSRGSSFRTLDRIRDIPFSMLSTLLSTLWTYWDPTWARARADRARGRTVIVEGRKVYLLIQLLAHFLRSITAFVLRFHLLTSSSSSLRNLSLLLLLSSALALLTPLLPIPYLKSPPPLRLASSSSSLAQNLAATPPPDPLEPLQHLSLRRGSSLLVPTPPASPSASSTAFGRGSLPFTVGLRSRRDSSAAKAQAEGRKRRPGLEQPQPSAAFEPPTDDNPFSPLLLLRSTAPAEGQAGGRRMDVDGVHAAGEARDDEPGGGENDNSMDWTPLPPPPSSHRTASASSSSGNIQLARQRFVPPDFRPPTGLEGILERVGLRSADEGGAEKMEVDSPGGPQQRWWS
ncbi:hypothetical protein JCM21900_000041, partial [Sporobolomyces salmonicolor]